MYVCVNVCVFEANVFIHMSTCGNVCQHPCVCVCVCVFESSVSEKLEHLVLRGNVC